MNSTTDRLRVAIVGIGLRGINCFGYSLASHPEVELAALCDHNRQRLRVASEKLCYAGPLYTDDAALYAAEQLDGVVITLPDYLHVSAIVRALDAGVPRVLVDKPLATTTADCLQVLAACNRTGGQVEIGFNLRHLPVLKKVRELIDGGAIGNVMLMENREFYDGGRTYMGRWNRRYEWSGGLWIHKGSHDFDIFNWWNEGGKPQRVFAAAGLNALRPDKIPFPLQGDIPVGPNCNSCHYRETCPDYSDLGSHDLFSETTAQADGYLKDLCIYTADKDVHDNGIAVVEYSNNVRASHLECFVCGFSDRQYTVAGERGTLMASLKNPTQIELRPRWGERKFISVPPAPAGGHGGADALLVDAFIDNWQHGRMADANVQAGLWSVAVGDAAERSWREGRSVEIEELMNGF